MYHHDDSTTWLRLIFIGLGIVEFAAGWALFRKFRDDRPEDQRGFRDWGLGLRGIIAYAGYVLIALGIGSCGLGLILPEILK